MDPIAMFKRTPGRRHFLTAAIAAVAGGAVSCQPRAGSLTAAPDPDIDQPWINPRKTEDPPTAPKRPKQESLTLDDISSKHGPALARLFMSNVKFRSEYYRLSRAWHTNWYHNGGCPGVKGGEFGTQWCELLERAEFKLGYPAGSLTLDDFGNLHTYLFALWRTMVLQMTGHDIEHAHDDTCPPGQQTIFTFHNIPNDGSDTSWGAPPKNLPFPP